MATTPTMGRPTIGGRPGDTPDDITKRRLYWGIALAVIVLAAIGLAMRSRNRSISTTTYDTSVVAPADTMSAPPLPAVVPNETSPASRPAPTNR